MPLVGLDIGNNNCKIVTGAGESMRMFSERLPENMMKEGELAEPEALASFIGDIRTRENIRDRDCVLVLSSDKMFFRRVSMPGMSAAEVLINLPYEFKDFIADDPDSFVYDYAVDNIVTQEDGSVERMELFAAAAPKELIHEYDSTLRKAGFKLKHVIPAQMVYARLLLEGAKRNPTVLERDIVFVDLGHADVTVSLFRGTAYDTARLIEFGCDEFDRIISETKGVDLYTAGSHKRKNFEDVMDSPECLAQCERFAVEISKVVNFYNFSNPDREIGFIFFLGGGAHIPQLTHAITEAVPIPAYGIEELLPPYAMYQPNAPTCALAVAGILVSEEM